jgi:hypothetical protein
MDKTSRCVFHTDEVLGSGRVSSQYLSWADMFASIR